MAGVKGKEVLSALDFAKGWIAGCREGLTLKEIAESLGMEYNACAARAKSLAKHFQGLENYKPKAGKRGRQLSAEDKTAIEALLSE